MDSRGGSCQVTEMVGWLINTKRSEKITINRDMEK